MGAWGYLIDPSQAKLDKRPDSRRCSAFGSPARYDCFYASVFEHENPALKALPLAVQQKQIVVTCNYVARKRGLYKMQLITEAKKLCPDVVIVLGEDLTRFRDASKDLYNFLQEFIWSRKVERLGFDEIFMDVTDMIDYNVGLLNLNDPSNTYFHLSRTDPTIGFSYDVTQIPGHTYPPKTPGLSSPTIPVPTSPEGSKWSLHTRLVIASHLARYLRHQLEAEKGYTCTSGVSTSKLLAKLAGATNKPNAQTTLLPPYESSIETGESNVTAFMDAHEVGRIPGIGFKLARKLRNYVLGRPADFSTGLAYGETREKVLVRHVRCFPSISPDALEKALGGPGSPQDIGGKVWGLLNGVDDTEVVLVRKAPRQISIEDSYLRLDTLEEVNRELETLAQSLIRRIHTDLLEDDDDPDGGDSIINPTGNDTLPTETETVADSPTRRPTKKRWIAHPRTIRLTTRPRRTSSTASARRPSTRISRSSLIPPFLLSLAHPPSQLATKLATETLLPLFRKLHPEKSGWDLSLINVAVMNMAEEGGQDIGKMFRRQEGVPSSWKVDGRDIPPSSLSPKPSPRVATAVRSPNTDRLYGSEDHIPLTQESNEDVGGVPGTCDDDDEGSTFQNSDECAVCGAQMPDFAMPAHERFHQM